MAAEAGLLDACQIPAAMREPESSGGGGTLTIVIG
jgi:hypothetical protein